MACSIVKVSLRIQAVTNLRFLLIGHTARDLVSRSPARSRTGSAKMEDLRDSEEES